jgi:hypothetical protein
MTATAEVIDARIEVPVSAATGAASAEELGVGGSLGGGAVLHPANKKETDNASVAPKGIKLRIGNSPVEVTLIVGKKLLLESPPTKGAPFRQPHNRSKLTPPEPSYPKKMSQTIPRPDYPC